MSNPRDKPTTNYTTSGNIGKIIYDQLIVSRHCRFKANPTEVVWLLQGLAGKATVPLVIRSYHNLTRGVTIRYQRSEQALVLALMESFSVTCLTLYVETPFMTKVERSKP